MNPSKWISAFQAVQSISPEEEQKSLCLADAWKLLWHPWARHRREPEEQLQDGQCPVGWKGHSPVPNPVCGLSLHCSHGMRQGREGKLFAVNFCKPVRELCKHLICTVWDVISAASQGKTFLSCWQLCTHVETRHSHQ